MVTIAVVCGIVGSLLGLLFGLAGSGIAAVIGSVFAPFVAIAAPVVSFIASVMIKGSPLGAGITLVICSNVSNSALGGLPFTGIPFGLVSLAGYLSLFEYFLRRIGDRKCEFVPPPRTVRDMLSTPSGDGRWETLLRYDPDLRTAVAELTPHGADYAKRFQQEYLTINSKEYLKPILERCLADAKEGRGARQPSAGVKLKAKVEPDDPLLSKLRDLFWTGTTYVGVLSDFSVVGVIGTEYRSFQTTYAYRNETGDNGEWHEIKDRETRLQFAQGAQPIIEQRGLLK